MSRIVETHALGIPGLNLTVSLPACYATSTEKFDVLYVLDEGSTLPTLCAEALTAHHEAVKDKDKRNWNPEVIVVCCQVVLSNDPSLYEPACKSIVGFIDGTYRTKPYSAARAICARAASPAALVRIVLTSEHGLAEVFRFFLLGSAGREPADSVATSSLPDKTAIFLSATKSEEANARALEAALSQRTSGGKTTETTMFVTRDGEQTYSEKERGDGAAVTVDLVEAAEEQALAASLADRGMLWLGERLEAQKLISLGSLLPWHEFK